MFHGKKDVIFCVLLLICGGIQFLEIPSKTIENRADAIVEGYPCSLETAFGDCFNEKAKHMSVLAVNSLRDLEDVNAFAVHHGLTSNRANLGRGKSSSMNDDLEKIAQGNPDRETIYAIKLEEAENIPLQLLPSDFVMYYDNEKYLCFFDKALLSDEPACQEVELITESTE